MNVKADVEFPPLLLAVPGNAKHGIDDDASLLQQLEQILNSWYPKLGAQLFCRRFPASKVRAA